MTAEAGLRDNVRSKHPIFVIVVLLAASAAAFIARLAGEERLLDEPDIPWPLFAVAFFFLERRTVDVHFRGEAHSFSMSDIPIVVGVFYLPPHLLLLAQLLGTLPAFGWSRRLPLIKTIFNSALYLFVAVLLISSVRAIPDVTELGPSAWAGVLVALGAVSVISALLISIMISMSSGAWPSDWSKGLSISVLVTLTNGCVGLLAVLALRADPLILLLFAPPAAILWLGYGAYTFQQLRHASLAKLNQASQETAASLSVDALGPLVLAHACDLLVAEYGELVVLSGQSVQRWAVQGERTVRANTIDARRLAAVLNDLSDGGASSESPGAEELKRYMAERGLREGAAARFSGERQGFLMIGNASAGTRERFKAEDIRLLENLTDHVAVLMSNARLLEELQTSLETAERTNEELMRTIADRDASEAQRSLLEDRLRHAHKMEAVGRLAGGIAHDFNNLLAIITGYAQLLDRGKNGEAAPVGVKEIVGAAERGSRLVKQLLLFSREGESPDPQLLDLNEVVKDMQGLLSMSGGAGVVLAFRFDPSAPMVCMDRGRFDQILLNLTVNARDAMGAGGKLTISTSIREDRDGERVCLSVADTGKGMSPEVLEHAFEPFFTTKERGSGTGLGLATVYAIVEEAGGKLEVRSVEGEGTTFDILLPPVREGVSTF